MCLEVTQFKEEGGETRLSGDCMFPASGCRDDGMEILQAVSPAYKTMDPDCTDRKKLDHP